MLRKTESLLQFMKQQIDNFIAADQQLQEFLTWVNQKSRAMAVPYKPAIVRAFYADLAIARALVPFGGTLELARALDRDLTCHLARPLALDLALDRALGLGSILERVFNPTDVVVCVLDRALRHARAEDPQLEQSLQQLKKQLPNLHKEKFMAWWQGQGGAWTEQLRVVMIKYRNFGYNWQLNEQQLRTLKQYYDANQFLVDCLGSSCDVTFAVRNNIEKTLLLPIAEIEKL